MEIENNIYIPSLEASDIYDSKHKFKNVKMNYKGMLPYSLELIKAVSAGLSVTEKDKNNPKLVSADMINVKFTKTSKTRDQEVKDIDKDIEYIENQIQKVDELLADDDLAKRRRTSLNRKKYKMEERLTYHKKRKAKLNASEDNLVIDSKSTSELREKYYTEGFTFKNKRFVVYKRSSSKSRKGECLFIKKDLYPEMIKWSRLGLDFEGQEDTDFASLLAYESLVLSSIESKKRIHPDNIFVIKDATSTYEETCDVVVEPGENEKNKGLKTLRNQTESITNEIWDGQSLLSEEYFDDTDKSFKLLRNHFFKSAAFKTKISKWLDDNYEGEYLTDSLGRTLHKDNIKLITTPNSCKFFKISYMVGSDREMFDHWAEHIKQDGCYFGVCKEEKPSKYKFDGKYYRELSYQIVNSLPINEKEELKQLMDFELDYIKKLKNDTQAFVDHLKLIDDKQDASAMFVDLYEQNPNVAQTKPFKKFRSKKIFNHVNYVKQGKFRISGDYLTLFANPLEMLEAILPEHREGFDADKYHNEGKCKLVGQQVHTKLYEDDKDKLTSVRNPHTSAANIVQLHNKHVEEIDTYFDLSEHIIVINNIKTPLLERWSGADMDSDVVLVSSSPILSQISDNAGGDKFPVVVNKVDTTSVKYTVNNHSMYQIDRSISQSGQKIGEITNVGQLLQSIYYDKLSKGQDTSLTYDDLCISVALSGLSIDLAKKKVKLNLSSELNKIRKRLDIKMEKGEKVYPLFWESVSPYTYKDGERVEKAKEKYHTPMDTLLEIIAEDKTKGDFGETIPFSKLLNDDYKSNNESNNQISRMDELTEEWHKENQRVNKKKSGDEDQLKREKKDVNDDYLSRFSGYKIKEHTLHKIMRNIDEDAHALLKLKAIHNNDKNLLKNSLKNVN